MNLRGAEAFSKGFTLIELLVVIVLIGLLASIGLTTVGSGNQGRALNNEVNRLHAVLRMASEEAIYSNTEIGVRFDSSTYAFLLYDEKEGTWVEAQQRFLRSYALPEWIVMEWRTDEEVYVPDESNSGSPVNDNDSEEKLPDLVMYSSGEVSPFVISLELDNDPDSLLEIKTNEQGEIILPHLLEQDV
jgi:general secretion pathway protein H